MTITPPTEPFSVSRMAVLECRSSGSRPPATITWWKRAKFMGKATEEVSNRKKGPKGYKFVQKLEDSIFSCKIELFEVKYFGIKAVSHNNLVEKSKVHGKGH